MEILLWLAPAALVTVVAAVLAGRAAAREEDERLRRLAARLEAEAARDADRLVVDDLEGISAPRPIRSAEPVQVPVDPATESARPEDLPGDRPADRPADRPREDRRSA